MIKFQDFESLLTDDQLHWSIVRKNLIDGEFNDNQVHDIARLAVASQYALQQLVINPQQVGDLLKLNDYQPPSLHSPLPADETLDITRLKRELRQQRHRKLLEIIYLDVVKQQPVAATLRQLSELADCLLQRAVEVCYHNLSITHGKPRHANGDPMLLNVLAAGKLGGYELNFSSDIDLICCYAHEGELAGFGNLSYQEFFTRLVQLLVGVLSDHTDDGFVYRVDLRLRPWGESSPVVLSHQALEHYYQLHGRDWEQSAMVRARVVTGSDSERLALVAIIKAFVYRRYHDHRLLQALALMKNRINRQAGGTEVRNNIKLGIGGIREIEFFVQALQLLGGGRNPRLQSTRIMDALPKLADEGLVDTTTIDQLTAAHDFLRLLENRLQMFADLQTHELPANITQCQRIALTMGFERWATLVEKLQRVNVTVSHHFNELFHAQELPRESFDLNDNPDHKNASFRQLETIRDTGVSEVEPIHEAFIQFLRSAACSSLTTRARERLGQLLPDLLKTIAGSQNQSLVFKRLLGLFAAIAGRSLYFELLAQNPPLRRRLVTLFHDSEWIADEVTRYPILLEHLVEGVSKPGFDRRQLRFRLRRQLQNVAGDRELELDCLRVFKREQTLLIADAELTGEIDTPKSSRYLSELAEVTLCEVLGLAESDLKKRHGVPRCKQNGSWREAQFAIIAYGKLGGSELHYQSDLDLVFLHDSRGEEQFSDAAIPLDNASYFVALAQKIISITNLMTTSGRLYEIDCRLRPQGSAGLLVSSIDAFRDYQSHKAWTWEHQALLRARAIVGPDSLKSAFEAVRCEALSVPRDYDTLRRDIASMRQRIRDNNGQPAADFFNLRHSPGGLIDIEFMVQFWALQWANSVGSICSYSDTISLLNELFRLGLITDTEYRLAAIYQHYHQLLHNSVLQKLSVDINSGLINDEAAHVLQCWKACFADLEN